MADEASEQANRAGMSPGRLVVIFYLGAGLVVAMFLSRMLAGIWAWMGWSDRAVVEGLEGWTVTGILGVALAGGAAVTCYVHPRIRSLSNEVASELMKVTWPSWAETRVSTTAVVVASLLAAVVLFGIDTMAYTLMVSWLPSLWGKL